MFENTEEKRWHWYGFFFIAFSTEHECEIEIENTIVVYYWFFLNVILKIPKKRNVEFFQKSEIM